MRNSLSSKKGFLICTDGTEHCDRSMKQAAVLAHHLDRPVKIASVAMDEHQLPIIKYRLKLAKKQLTEMGIKNVSTTARVGDPVEEIVAIAKRYSMIVVADSGKSRFKRFIKGSVAFNIMGRAPVSVMNAR